MFVTCDISYRHKIPGFKTKFLVARFVKQEITGFRIGKASEVLIQYWPSVAFLVLDLGKCGIFNFKIGQTGKS